MVNTICIIKRCFLFLDSFGIFLCREIFLRISFPIFVCLGNDILSGDMTFVVSLNVIYHLIHHEHGSKMPVVN